MTNDYQLPKEAFLNMLNGGEVNISRTQMQVVLLDNLVKNAVVSWS